MTRKRTVWILWISIILPLLLLVFPAHMGTAAKRANTRPVDEVKQRPAASFIKLPLSFEVNQGQSDPRVKFLSRGRGYALFLTGSEAVLSLDKPSSVSGQPVHSRGPKPRSRVPRSEPSTPAVLRLELVGANPAARITGLEELPGKSNYFLGNDPKKWRSNVPTYARVKYENIYPGVELVYYGNQRQLEYDFVVAPGADPKAIGLAIDSALGAGHGVPLRIDAQGDLRLQADGGEVRLQKPIVYQPMTGDPKAQIQNRKPLDGGYVLLAGNRIGFEIPNYDKTKPLVIDPVLRYSTYLGGTGWEGGSSSVSIAVDASGNAYVASGTSGNFPVTPDAYQATFGGAPSVCNQSFPCGDAVVAKIDPTASVLIYSTYLGGSGDDYAYGLAVDSAGNTYVAGVTNSTNFPTTPGAYQTSPGGGYDIFVTKLNPTGSSLVYSTYLGGSEDEGVQALALDSSGDAYVAGSSQSPNFPTTPGAWDTTFDTAGGLVCLTNAGLSAYCHHAIVTKLNPTGTGLIYSTFLGGDGTDEAGALAVDSSGAAYVAGDTTSRNFPTMGAYQAHLVTAACGPGFPQCPATFLTKLTADGTALLYSTYLGGSGDQYSFSNAVDSSGNAYLVGLTSSNDFPTTAGAFQTTFGGPYVPDCSAWSGCADAFVLKIDTTKTGLGSLVYSTYLGGTGNDWGAGIAVDPSGNAYVTGWTNSTDFPTQYPLQPGNAGGYDVFITELNPAGTGLIFSTYLGGNGDELGDSIALGPPGTPYAGNAYVGGWTESTDFPTTPGVLQPTFGGGRDLFIANILYGVSLSTTALTFASQPEGTTSAPQTVTLTNTGSAGSSITSVAVMGTNASDFVQTSTCGGLAPGASCSIIVTFTPSATGTRTASVSITDNASGSPYAITLLGTGVPEGAITGNLLTFLVQPSNTIAGQVISPAVRILAEDSTGAVVPGAYISLNIWTNPGGGTLSGTIPQMTDAYGIATFSNLSIDRVGSGYTLVASVVGCPFPMFWPHSMGFNIVSPVPEISQPLVPMSAVPAGSGFTLTVNGTGFVSGAAVEWNGTARTTTFVSSTQLTATINTSDIAVAGTAWVTVVNPGAQTSNVVFFPITSPTPSLTFANAPGSPIAVPAPPGGLGSNPMSIAVGDFNGDGKLDLAIANNCVSCSPVYPSTLAILLGNGDGTFRTAPGSPITVPFGPEFVGAGDFNGDGKLDLVVANMFGNGLTILLGNGDGSFTPAAGSPITTVGGNPISIGIGDFNGDGILDLAVTNGTSEAHNLTILLGKGDGTFTAVSPSPATGSAPAGIAVGDFNGDGKLDLAVTNEFDNTVTVLLGNGDGTFTPTASSPLAVGTGPLGVAVGDFNGDGKLDLAVVNVRSNNVTIFLGKGDGTFTPASGSPVAVGTGPNAVAVGDFNGDGKLDLAVSNYGSNNVTILLGNGDGTFTPASSSPVAVGAGPTAVAVGDFNRDGRLDLGTANDAGNTVSILLQTPIVSLSASSVNFANQTVGTSSAFQTVTLTNTGSAPMAISSVSLSGANAANFTLTHTCPVLTPPSSCASSAAFFNAFPAASPPFSSMFYVTAANASGDRLVVGTPTGGAAALISALSLIPLPNVVNQEFCDFVQLVPGVQALAYVPTTAERGGNFSAFAGLLIDPTTGSAVAGGTLLPTSTFWAWRVPGNAFSSAGGLAPGATCAIDLSFSPATMGPLSAQVTVADNASGSPQTVNLSGIGVTLIAGMAVSLAPPSLVFPAESVGNTSPPQVVTLMNTGVLPVTISSIVTSGDYAQTNTCPSPTATLAPGASCPISVTFTPTVAGSDPGTLTITDNASDSPQSVPLAAAFTTTPVSVSPGTTTTFTNGTIMTETVTLPSDAVMNGTATKAVSFIPVSPAVFSSTRLPGTPQSPNWSGGITPIPSATTCTIISGTGGNCVVVRDLCFDSSGNPITCDIVAPTTPIQLTSHYETPSSPSCPGYIIADDGQTNWAIITNLYYPGDTTQGGSTKTLNTDTTVVDLGAGYCATSATGPAVSLAPLSLVFPAQEVGTASSPLVVTLTNSGVSPLTISNIVTSGDYTQTNTCPIPTAALAPGAHCSISVTFTPTVSGIDPGMLTITDNASDSPQSVPLATSTPPQPVSPGTSTTFNGTITFSNGTVMSETVLLPPDAVMNGTAYKAVSFIQVPPAVFSSTRLPPTPQSPDWSGGITPIPNTTTCTTIAGTGGNCIVIRDLCFDSSGKPVLPCDIVAPTTPIQLTFHYETQEAVSCPGYIIADDNQTNWADITTSFNAGDTGQGGSTKTLNTDTTVGDLGAAYCATNRPSGTTPPTTTAVTSPLTPNGTNGWFTTSPVTVILTSIGDTLVEQIVYSINGGTPVKVLAASTLFQISNQGVTTISYQATDEAGHVETLKMLTVMIDTTPPVVNVTGVTNGATYPLGAVPTAGCSTSDAISGVATPATLTLTGGVPPGVGSFTATCSGAVDNAGIPQAAPVTATYTVTPGPVASVSPSSINFGTVYLGTITVKSVTVANQGDAPMTITDPFLSILSGGDSHEFVAVNLCPKSLAAGSRCTMYVNFLAGPFYNPQTATLNVVDNAPGSPQTVALTATVINPQAHLSATSLSFGGQKVGKSSAAKAVTLTNTGATPLTINSIAIAGTDPLDFKQTNNCLLLSPLAANAACTINVTFTPAARGLLSGSVVITDNAQNSPQYILLSGTGD